MNDRTIAAATIAVAADTVPLLMGAAGTAKSSICAQIAEHLGMHFIPIYAGHKAPQDIHGIPIHVDGDETRVAPPAWVREVRRRAEAGEPTLILLDELTTCRQSVQTVLLAILLDRLVGETRLPESTRIITAANPPDEATDGQELRRPMWSRLVLIPWEFDLERYTSYLLCGEGRLDLPRVGEYNPRDEQWAARVAGFLRKNPGRANDSKAEDGPYPCPRSWSTFIRLMAAVDATEPKQDPAVRHILGAGSIGAGTAAEFFAHCEGVDLPDPEEVLKAPEKFPLPDRGDTIHVMLLSVVAAVLRRTTSQRWQAAWTLLARVAKEFGADVAAVAALQLTSNVKGNYTVSVDKLGALNKVLLPHLKKS
jgi:hypothetical protein